MAVIAVLAACGALGGAAASASASASSADARLGRALSALVRMPGGPPGIVSVVQRDGRREVFRRGVANLRTGARIRLGDHWRIASVSKAFSGAVALRLVAQGKLSLDDTIASRLPGLPAAWGSVTLAQALQHVSGLPDYSTSPALQDQLRTAPRAPLMPAALISYVADQPLDFPPGSAYHYSNTDNVVAGLFAEAATGLSYERVLGQLVLSPLALRHTSMPLGYRMPSPYVHGYDNNVRGRRADGSELVNASAVWAAGGMVSAPLDLNRFARAYAGGTLFGGAARAAQVQFRAGGGSDPPGPGQNAAGLALFRYRTRCGTVYGHTGNFLGYTTFMASSPDGTRSVTVHANTQLDWNPQLGNQVGSHAAFRALRRAFGLGVCAALA